MKHIVIGSLFLIAISAHAASDCDKWQSQVDPSVVYSGPLPHTDQMSDAEKVQAFACLLELAGREDAAKISGVTRPDISQLLPHASVEVAALFYIRFLFLGKWDHADGITLVDRRRKWNRKRAIKAAYASYHKWLAKVQEIGIKEARRRNLDPMDECPGVRWY